MMFSCHLVDVDVIITTFNPKSPETWF